MYEPNMRVQKCFSYEFFFMVSHGHLEILEILEVSVVGEESFSFFGGTKKSLIPRFGI